MFVILPVAQAVFVVACLGLAAVFVLYPAFLAVCARFLSRPERPLAGLEPPPVSVIVAVRNGAGLIEAKIRNTLASDYPADRLEVVIFSDGSTDRTLEIAGSLHDPRVRLAGTDEHFGKMHALNQAFEMSKGEITVFTDADAQLDAQAIARMVAHLADPQVGGVCGLRMIGGRDQAALKDAQSAYISFDSRIKNLESRLGSITSNDGKVYAIRRRLYRPIPPGVTDDLYVALNVVDQGGRFVFDPAVWASIHVPSRESLHEISRRRRIVCRSLRGIFLMRRLLNPFRSGWFAFGLFVNKVVRRLLPLLLFALLASSAALAAFGAGRIWRIVLVAQLCFYLFGLSAGLLGGKARKLARVIYYFVIGGYGTLLGCLDFLGNRVVAKWDPAKGDVKDPLR